MTTKLIEQLRTSKIVAILRLNDLSDATPIVDSLFAGGIRFLEFTLTNPKAPSVLREVRTQLDYFEKGDAAIGLGSIRNLDEAKLAIDSGAQFVVCPIVDLEVIRYCRSVGIPVMPGAMTPTEIYTAWKEGADVVKLFPAGNLGPSYLRDVLAPMPFLPIMPTGGITLDNMQSYFRSGAIAVGIGSSLIPGDALIRRDWGCIESAARAYVDACTSST